jgi:predicted PurR-regulated permease PerM
MKTVQWQRLAVIGICASAAVFLGWVLWLVIGFLAPVLGLFFGGWLLACLEEPLVAWVTRRTHAGRPTAVAVTLLGVVFAVVVVGLVAAPILQREVSVGLTSLPSQFDAGERQAVALEGTINGWLAEQGVPFQVDVASSPGLDSVAQQTLGGASSPLTVVDSVFAVLGQLGTMLLLSVFFLLGGSQLADQVVHFAGSRAAPDVQFVLTTIHDAFEGFVRSQLLEGALFGVAVWACLSAAQVASAPIIGVLAGLMLLVPMVGAALAVVVPVLATLLWNPSAVLVVTAALVLFEQLVLNVIGPRLMSKQLGLPPLLVLFGILAGGQVGGFWGAVFGIPVLATFLTCVDHFRARWDPDPDTSADGMVRVVVAENGARTAEV